MDFHLESTFSPTGDQPQAIEKLVNGLQTGARDQVLLGVTGSGKTFTMANVIEKRQQPTLIISHNKTLAAQLAQEFKEFFPHNAVCYFVSYYDYYQPEAYIPQTDTYIEKETQINELIDKLRLEATTALLTRKDVIVVASVSCIYSLGSPANYSRYIIPVKRGASYSRKKLIQDLIRLSYVRNDFDLARARFRIRGESIDIFPASSSGGGADEENPIRVTLFNDIITDLYRFDSLSGKKTTALDSFVFYPAKHYVTPEDQKEAALQQIESDVRNRIAYFKKHKKHLEAQRLEQRTRYDLEMIKNVGFCSGIENYSRYFDGRKLGEPPYSLLDYYLHFPDPVILGRSKATTPESKKNDSGQTSLTAGQARMTTYNSDWLLFIDESHITVPQIRGMYEGDHSRKKTLIDFGFRLPSAFDNRPLTFDEFQARIPQTIYVSATPDEWELQRAREKRSGGVVEQLVRPTGLLDPQIIIRSTIEQIPDLTTEIEKRVEKGERVLATTLTKRTAEDLAEYLKERQIKATYLHADVETLKRTTILEQLRRGEFDVLVGINLLREGLDLPEVSLVAILDADKESFLRSQTSLIQVMGRAARHINGQVIMYADAMSGSMKRAIAEVERRRTIQEEYNQKYGIIPQTIIKPIRKKLIEEEEYIEKSVWGRSSRRKGQRQVGEIDFDELANAWDQYLAPEKEKIIAALQKEMRESAKDLDFERAAKVRDLIVKLKLEARS